MNGNARTWIFLLSLLVPASTAAQEPGDPPAQDAQTEELRARIFELETDLADAQERLAEMEQELGGLDPARELDARTWELRDDLSHLLGVGSVLAFLLTISLAGGLALLWERAKKRIDRLVTVKAKKLLDKRFATESDHRFAQIVQQFSDLVNLLSHAEREHHDQAIESVSWDRKNRPRESLREYPEEIRKRIIESVVLSERYKRDLGGIAWDEAEAILQKSRMEPALEDKRQADLAFLYVLARLVREWSRGFRYYQRFGHEIAITTDPQGFAALLEILRLNHRFREALDAERKYEGPTTDEIRHRLGHLYYNVGAFEKAEDFFRPLIEKILASRREDAPADWAKIVTSFLMNCIDGIRPKSGIEAARWALTQRKEALLQLWVLRLALALKEASIAPEASDLADGVRRNLESAAEDSPSLQARALLKVFDHGDEGATAAVALLREKQGKVLSQETLALLPPGAEPPAGSSLELQRPEYFYVCLVGELLIRAERHDQARQVLHTPSLQDLDGSANFLIAWSYAREKRDKEAAKYLERAGMIVPCWCRIAKLYPELRASHERLRQSLCAKVPRFEPL